jgi:hypothetical protein
MFALRLVQLIETHADALSEGLTQKVKSSERCGELLRRVPAEELKRRTYEIYRNLSDWLVTKTESEVEERYVGLGARRARQGVPFSHLFWAVCTTKQHLWEYLQREGLMEGPVDFWGEMELLRELEQFFDSALYFASIGYESVRKDEHARSLASHASGSHLP